MDLMDLIRHMRLAELSQLARRSQRVLLGQEWTPAWLARDIVKMTLAQLPAGSDPRFIDMCCGSGAMVVEVVKQTRQRFEATGILPSLESLRRLSQAISGFDIDPLAVMLAKFSWILAAREWIDRAGAFDISIPIYHADSLFASTPISKKIDLSGVEKHELDLDGKKVIIPAFLVSSEFVALFDGLLTVVYDAAMVAARNSKPALWGERPRKYVIDACQKTETILDSKQTSAVNAFVSDLLLTLETLQRNGRNGIWAFVIRNSYRPGLVTGRFNGLVSNPPWLAMSKVANNPYKETLVGMTELYGIKPEGASHLHTELATIFLLHAVERYLEPGAVIGCVLPESLLSAHHHNPFRRGAYWKAKNPVLFMPREIWQVEKGTFKNEAIVLFGSKVHQGTKIKVLDVLIGKHVSMTGATPLTFHVVSQGFRTAWSDKLLVGKATGFFNPAPFRQGADVFPRTAIFQEVTPRGKRFDLSKISKTKSSLAYLVNEAKKQKDFSITAQGIDGKFLFDILLSNHLTPFRLEAPAVGFLPFEHSNGNWKPVSELSIAESGPSTKQAFKDFFRVAGGERKDAEGCYALVDTPRKKLSNQVFPAKGWLVVMGAGGKFVCAASMDVSSLKKPLIIDQTLYWAVVPSHEEALYLTGLLNSEAINSIIGQFQPRGQFGERHIHKLPLGATPPFNPLDAAHIDVVIKTKELLQQWSADLEAHPEAFVEMLNLNNRLSNRRIGMRKRLKALQAYSGYEIACRSLYAV